MSHTEIANLSLHEKLQIMEALWADLRSHEENLVVPKAHRELLDARRKRVASGETKLLNWDDIKHSIERR